MLKCRRIILDPAKPSRYGKLRREPRSDGLSTLESVAMLMAGLERKPEIETRLLASFDRMLETYKTATATVPELAPKPKPKRDYRRKKRA
jgi:DTW domain-containing protein YfiP